MKVHHNKYFFYSQGLCHSNNTISSEFIQKFQASDIIMLCSCIISVQNWVYFCVNSSDIFFLLFSFGFLAPLFSLLYVIHELTGSYTKKEPQN